MLFKKLPHVGVYRGVLQSLRVQLVAVLSGGVALPAFVTTGASLLGGTTLAGSWTTLAGAATAATALCVILRRFAVYPAAPIIRSILPLLAMLYGAFLLLLTFFRLEYSNKILLSCFLGTLIVRFGISAINMRGKRMIYWVVPGGDVDVIEGFSGISTLRVHTPDLPKKFSGTYIADLHFEHKPDWERFLAEAAISGKAVFHYKQVWESATGRVQIRHLSENSFGALLPSLAYGKLKRVVDFLFCVLVLPLVLPLLLVIGILVRLDSPGPAFFRQRRMGFRGRPFLVLKFRTMTALEDGGDRAASQTAFDDERITRLGRFLRRTRLDELPQIWNVAKGEMSWIGPRPEAVSLSEWYEAEIPFYRYRHIVRPGITGWAQVNQGHVSSLNDVNDKLQYDFYYIKYLSYWLDLLIVFRTFRVIFSGFGAK